MEKKGKSLKLTLTTEDGEVVDQWSIGQKYEFDLEDLEARPEHDFYRVEGRGDMTEHMQIVVDEILSYFSRKEREENE